jgi:hypothetical protein
VIPLLIASYFVACLDRADIGFAGPGMNRDLRLGVRLRRRPVLRQLLSVHAAEQVKTG